MSFEIVPQDLVQKTPVPIFKTLPRQASHESIGRGSSEGKRVKISEPQNINTLPKRRIKTEKKINRASSNLSEGGSKKAKEPAQRFMNYGGRHGSASHRTRKYEIASAYGVKKSMVAEGQELDRRALSVGSMRGSKRDWLTK